MKTKIRYHLIPMIGMLLLLDVSTADDLICSLEDQGQSCSSEHILLAASQHRRMASFIGLEASEVHEEEAAEKYAEATLQKQEPQPGPGPGGTGMRRGRMGRGAWPAPGGELSEARRLRETEVQQSCRC